jgi:hypothetical protein
MICAREYEVFACYCGDVSDVARRYTAGSVGLDHCYLSFWLLVEDICSVYSKG